MNTPIVTIIDYRMGNLGSIRNMFARLGVETRVVGDPDAIRAADRLVLPGVGHFSNGATQLAQAAIGEALHEQVRVRGRPLLGICVGHQLLAGSSEEGPGEGLGWLDARCVRFRSQAQAGGRPVPIPQMGWNYVAPTRAHPVIDALGREARFYFANSYWMSCADDADNLLLSVYGGQRFAAAVAKESFVGVQFHPEKSHRFGMRLLEQFARWTP